MLYPALCSGVMGNARDSSRLVGHTKNNNPALVHETDMWKFLLYHARSLFFFIRMVQVAAVVAAAAGEVLPVAISMTWSLRSLVNGPPPLQ